MSTTASKPTKRSSSTSKNPPRRKRTRTIAVSAKQRDPGDGSLMDLQCDLDHVLTVGLSVRRKAQRLQQFQKDHEPQLQADAAQSTDLPTTRQGAPKDVPDNYLHAEDVRIYGEGGSVSKEAWPEAVKRSVVTGLNKELLNDDKLWNLEHGDTIHPLAFSKAKLSAQHVPAPVVLNGGAYPPESYEEDGKNRYIRTTDISLEHDQVPRALLLRCWERAVHAASTTMFAPVSADPMVIPTTNSNKKRAREGEVIDVEEDTNDDDENGDYGPQNFSKEAAQHQCQKWDILLPTTTGAAEASFTCPRCTVEFETARKLRLHFYGTNDGENHKAVKGCCWPLVHAKQRAQIAAILQQDVQTQVDQLVELILKQAKLKMMHSSKTAIKRRLFNWYDVLKLVRGAINSAPHRDPTDEALDAHPALLATLETKKDQSPMVLNPMILERVRQRLIERYADVPY